jgi:hypothetical protein
LKALDGKSRRRTVAIAGVRRVTEEASKGTFIYSRSRDMRGMIETVLEEKESGVRFTENGPRFWAMPMVEELVIVEVAAGELIAVREFRQRLFELW